uniref:Uncharacterized protein n=1 Tax=viral metagenome TaxID=1070528 RepID=A0A6C0EXD2_9ZZZZ
MNPRAITFVLRAFMFIVILLSMHNIISLVKNSQTYKHHSINIDKTLNIPFIFDLPHQAQIILNKVSSLDRRNPVALANEVNNTITTNKITIKIPDVNTDPYFLHMLFM